MREVYDKIDVNRLLVVLLSVMLSGPGTTMAQELHNTSTLYINGANLHVDGSINNAGTMVNDGYVTFSMDWKNVGTYEGSGALEANGTGSQIVSHHGQDVSSLEMSGGGAKKITGQLNITRNLRLTNGIATVSSLDQLIVRDGATVSGGSVYSFVNGALTAEGTGYRFFPVGKNETYAPMELLDVSGASPLYSIEVFEDALPTGVDNIEADSELFWRRTDIDGVFGGARVRLEYNPEKFPDRDDIVLLTGTDWEHPFIPITALETSHNDYKVTTTSPLTTSLILMGKYSREGHHGFYFPTALSPHATHPDNRRVKVFGRHLSKDEFILTVFDRWGNVVFESTSLEEMSAQGWDGQSKNGAQLVSGVYPYRITGSDKTGKKFERQGIITIVY